MLTIWLKYPQSYQPYCSRKEEGGSQVWRILWWPSQKEFLVFQSGEKNLCRLIQPVSTYWNRKVFHGVIEVTKNDLNGHTIPPIPPIPGMPRNNDCCGLLIGLLPIFEAMPFGYQCFLMRWISFKAKKRIPEYPRAQQ